MDTLEIEQFNTDRIRETRIPGWVRRLKALIQSQPSLTLIAFVAHCTKLSHSVTGDRPSVFKHDC